MIMGGSVLGFIVGLCFVAGFLFAKRAGKSTGQVFFLTILFGVVFLIALCGLAVAGCIAVLTTAH